MISRNTFGKDTCIISNQTCEIDCEVWRPNFTIDKSVLHIVRVNVSPFCASWMQFYLSFQLPYYPNVEKGKGTSRVLFEGS